VSRFLALISFKILLTLSTSEAASGYKMFATFLISFICSSFNDAVGNSDCALSSDSNRVKNELEWTRRKWSWPNVR
jgi:hypothetical protein